MSQHSPEQLPQPAPLNSQNVPLTKPQQGSNQTTRREIDRVARQLEGLSKSLRQLKERV